MVWLELHFVTKHTKLG